MNDFSVSVSIELTQEAYPEGYPDGSQLGSGSERVMLSYFVYTYLFYSDQPSPRQNMVDCACLSGTYSLHTPSWASARRRSY